MKEKEALLGWKRWGGRRGVQIWESCIRRFDTLPPSSLLGQRALGDLTSPWCTHLFAQTSSAAVRVFLGEPEELQVWQTRTGLRRRMSNLKLTFGALSEIVRACPHCFGSWPIPNRDGKRSWLRIARGKGSLPPSLATIRRINIAGRRLCSGSRSFPVTFSFNWTPGRRIQSAKTGIWPIS